MQTHLKPFHESSRANLNRAVEAPEVPFIISYLDDLINHLEGEPKMLVKSKPANNLFISDLLTRDALVHSVELCGVTRVLLGLNKSLCTIQLRERKKVCGGFAHKQRRHQLKERWGLAGGGVG